MSVYSLSKNPLMKNTYEIESNQYKSQYSPYITEQNMRNSNNLIEKRLSQSPPIIICESNREGGSLHSHRHHYLFYPSVSRLSPYTEENKINNITLTNRGISNNFDLEKEINKLRDENRLIKEEYQNRNMGMSNGNNFYGTNRGNNRASSVNYTRTKGKYDDLLNKSNELMNSIHNLIEEEEGKVRGPLGYYNNTYYNNNNTRGKINRDKEFNDFVERQKNLFNSDDIRNNKNFNSNNYNTDYYNNTDYNKFNDRFRRDYLDNNNDMNSNNMNSNTSNNNYNRNKSFNDNRNIYSNNNNNNNNDNTEGFNSNNNNIFNRNNDYNRIKSYHDNKNIYSNNNNDNNYNNNTDGYQNNNLRNYNNRNNNNDNNNNIYSQDNNNENNRINDNNNNIRSGDGTNDFNFNKGSKMDSNIEQVKNKNGNNNNNIGGNYNNDNFDDNKGNSTMPIHLGKNFTLNNDIDDPNQKNLANSDSNIYFNKQDNNQNIGSNVMGMSSKGYSNNDNNNNNNNNFNNNNNPNNNNNDLLRNQNQEQKNLNPFDIALSKTVKYIPGENFSEKDEDGSSNQMPQVQIKSVLTDKKDNVILSEEGKPFIAEENVNIKKDGNLIFAIMNNGEEITLRPIRNKDGEILTDTNGNIILGIGQRYFIDKEGQIVISDDLSLAKGDQVVPAKSKKIKINPNETFYKNINEGGNFGMTSTYWGKKTKNLSKSRRGIFAKGYGDAKAPITKKKRKKSKKK